MYLLREASAARLAYATQPHTIRCNEFSRRHLSPRDHIPPEASVCGGHDSQLDPDEENVFSLPSRERNICSTVTDTSQILLV